MKSSTTIAVLFLGMLGLFGFGCAESAPSLKAPAAPAAPATPAPAANEATPSAPESAPDQTAAAHSLDVGMEFKEKDESENRRASHDAPPTGAWKPVGKDKSIDGKKSPTSK